MPFAVVAVTVALIKTGAWLGTVNWRVVGFEGVRLTPAAVVKDGVRMMVAATVPVCSAI